MVILLIFINYNTNKVYVITIIFFITERTIIVAQYSGKTLSEYSVSDISVEFIIKLAKNLANALQYLHSLSITHRNLSPENILISDKDEIKLFNYGLYYMTLNGKYVSFPIG